jgi:radical SAM protein with 4Fe4S-binding SPASM domain
MSTRLARAIIEEISANGLTGSLMFHLMGEPLLHRDWFEIFEHAAGRDLDITFGTNCSRLDDSALDRLYSLPLKRIIVSLQTPTPSTFGLRRTRRFTFESYIGRIKRVIWKKFERGHDVKLLVDLLNTCSLVRKLVDLRSDIRVLEDDRTARAVVREWIDFARTVIACFDLEFAVPSQAEVDAVRLRKGFALEILPGVILETKRAVNWGNALANGTRIIPGVFGGCGALSGSFGILWNGDLVLCCADFDGRTVLGNVRRTPIVDILSTDYAEKIRRNFKWGVLTHPYCRRCRGGTTVRTWFSRQIGTFITHTLRIPILRGA